MSYTKALKTSYFFVTLLLIFRAGLDHLYVIFISPIYAQGYNKFQLNIEFDTYLFSWLFYILGIFLVNHRIKKVSDYFFLMAILGIVGPLTTLYGLDTNRDIFPVIISIMSLYIIAGITKFNIFPTPKIAYFKNSRNAVVYFSAFCVLVLIVWYFASGAVANINFDLTKVYEFREKSSKLTDTGFMAYFNVWTYKIFNIFLMLVALHRKNYKVFVMLFLIQGFFFGVSAHKAVIFFPFLILSIWYYFRKTNLAFVLPLGFLSIMLASYVLFLILDNTFIPSLLIRRVFFVPASATFNYFEFFSDREYIFWSDSILSSILTYRYDQSLSLVIGDYMNPGQELGANNGFISRGYANAGVLGVLFYSLIAGYILKILDSLGKSGVPLWFSLCMTVIPLRTFLISSDLFTTMLSHGLLIALLLVVMLRSKSNLIKQYDTVGE